MSAIKPAIIDRFIDLNQQISNWNFKRDGRLPQSLIDQSQLIRRWAWDNGIGPDELRLATLIHQRADAAIPLSWVPASPHPKQI